MIAIKTDRRRSTGGGPRSRPEPTMIPTTPLGLRLPLALGLLLPGRVGS